METILIIEDDGDIRDGAAEILKMSGYKVITAENGKSGVAKATRQRPDLVLCDIMMPELDGYGVLSILSKSPDTAAIPFIFLTAKTEQPDLRKGMALGADDYLIKPFDDKELLHAINCRLQKQDNLKIFYSRSLTSLRRLTFGQVRGSNELKRLIADRKLKQLKKKHVLYYEGDEPQGIYLVLEGFIKTFKLIEDGRELVTGLYKAEEYVGINEIFADKHLDTAEAIDDSVVCLLPKDMIMNLLSQYPDISQQFMRILCDNVREKEEQLLQFAYSSVRKRMLQVLTRLQARFPDRDDFKISRDELSAMAGMATETVSRILTDFKEEGLIERKGSHIKILNAINFAKARQ